jgi:hypothetical protein
MSLPENSRLLNSKNCAKRRTKKTSHSESSASQEEALNMAYLLHTSRIEEQAIAARHWQNERKKNNPEEASRGTSQAA